MKKFASILVATTALTAAMGLSAWSLIRTPAVAGEHSLATVLDDGREALSLIFVSDDDDDEGEDEQRRHNSSQNDDDEGEDDDDDDDDTGDDDNEYGKARRPVPAIATTPPQNGLFGNAAPPKVQVK